MALDFKKTFGYNRTKADEGMWADIGHGASIKVAKIGTIKYQNTMIRHTRKYQAQFRVNRYTAEATIDIAASTLADCILLDWKGITEDGQEVPYSRANAYRLLKESDDFRSLVEMYGNDADLFQDNIIDVEDDQKNLPITSNGT
jgi:hypothetical protein